MATNTVVTRALFGLLHRCNASTTTIVTTSILQHTIGLCGGVQHHHSREDISLR